MAVAELYKRMFESETIHAGIFITPVSFVYCLADVVAGAFC